MRTEECVAYGQLTHAPVRLAAATPSNLEGELEMALWELGVMVLCRGESSFARHDVHLPHGGANDDSPLQGMAGHT